MRPTDTPRYGTLLVILFALVITTRDHVGAQGQVSPGAASGAVALRLAATAHPQLPGHPSQYWYVHDAARGTSTVAAAVPVATGQRFAQAIDLIADGQYSNGLALIDRAALAGSPLEAYAHYYTGVALAGLGRYTDADTAYTTAASLRPSGYLSEALPLKIADIALGMGDRKRAIDTLEAIEDKKLSVAEDVFLQLGRAYELAGRKDDALEAYRRVYYDFPMSVQASDAQSALERLQTLDSRPRNMFELEMARAEKLFAARRWAQARAGFDVLRRVATGDDRDLVNLRIAECDYYLDRHRAARDTLRPYQDGGAREAEARFFYLTATRALGSHDSYLSLARDLINDFPDSSWAEEALNNLASHYILVDDDAQADVVFREVLQKFPRSRHSERAAWKVGWRLYRDRKFAEAAGIFEWAAAAHPRADYRPSWLYWAARSRDQVGEPSVANERYRLVIADYQNSYYGRLAAKLLAARRDASGSDGIDVPPVRPALPPPVVTDTLIRELVALRLYETAQQEIQYAQRVWGDSAQLQATVAFIRHNQGLTLKGVDRFNAIRGAITMMRRAYPQFMAAGGEELPPDVLRIIFPIDYWPLITKYSKHHELDPFLVTALIAQESTFTPEIRSHANAYGLMQLVPAAGRQYARKVGIRYSQSLLTQPEPNVRLGTEYLKDVSERFGGVHYALASYNAGPHRVAQWLKETPSLPQDEFIDNIPFPETQNYVKRILGTAEDYRRLYGGGLLDPDSSLTAERKAVSGATTAAKPATAKPTTSTTRSKATPKRSTPRKPARSTSRTRR
jgi:soluble lytic murein transglycosylase